MKLSRHFIYVYVIGRIRPAGYTACMHLSNHTTTNEPITLAFTLYSKQYYYKVRLVWYTYLIRNTHLWDSPVGKYGKIHWYLKASFASPLPRWLGRDVGATSHLTWGGRIKHCFACSRLDGKCRGKNDLKGISQRVRISGLFCWNVLHFCCVFISTFSSRKLLINTHVPPSRTQSQ